MSSDDSGARGRAKTLGEAQQWMLERLTTRIYPMNAVDLAEGRAIVESLAGLDGRAWAEAWGRAGDRAREEAERAEAAGDRWSAVALFMRAHGLYFLGRFPAPNHPDKARCAELERATHLAAGRHWDPPVRRVTVPFDGRRGEGREVAFLYRRPPGIARPPAVVLWGGLDAWKEQMAAASNALLAVGFATLAVDCPGTGESPIACGPDGERQFWPVFEWAAAQPDLDARKVGCFGRSFGGYWATKLAHVRPDRVAAAVNWGGGAHYMFQPEWLAASRHPESYLMGLAEARCRMLGADDDDECDALFARLSLLDQGLLDRPCAPLLLVHGKHDEQCPIEDVHLVLEHGGPKSVRLFPGGHAANAPRPLHAVVGWLAERLGAERRLL
ncbi:MAG TPA: alpha/beta hydrolase [Polyangiaceae bacterium]|nr:alpha/beta hydrolase [Polyangiaceae bacterium]